MSIQSCTIDEGSNNFDCHDVDDMKQLLNYLERKLQGNLDVPVRWRFESIVKGLKKELKEAS
jgi:hypothetical protein